MSAEIRVEQVDHLNAIALAVRMSATPSRINYLIYNAINVAHVPSKEVACLVLAQLKPEERSTWLESFCVQQPSLSDKALNKLSEIYGLKLFDFSGDLI